MFAVALLKPLDIETSLLLWQAIFYLKVYFQWVSLQRLTCY